MIWQLLIIYQLKHFFCDYPFQTTWMLGKFKRGWGWIVPLAAHAGVHGVATFLIALYFKPEIAFLVATLDFIVHFTMDRIKASPNLLGRFKALSSREYFNLVQPKLHPDHMEPEQRERHAARVNQLMRHNTFFWWSLGLDQMVHHLTHYAIICMLLH